jgi:hypothetical protein
MKWKMENIRWKMENVFVFALPFSCPDSLRHAPTSPGQARSRQLDEMENGKYRHRLPEP